MNITLMTNYDEAVATATKWAANSGLTHLVVEHRFERNPGPIIPAEMTETGILYSVVPKAEHAAQGAPGYVMHAAHPAVPVPTLRRVIDKLRRAADFAALNDNAGAADAYTQAIDAIEGVLP